MSTPALTAEERARDVTALLMKRLPGTGISIVMADRDDAHAQIASAIREAEDAAYERAAAATLGQIPLWLQAKAGAQAKDYWEGYRDAIDDALEDIRSLKSQKETP